MQVSLNDQDPGRPKAVTNADEQDVAVNHSTADDGGYAEPSSVESTTREEVNIEITSKELSKEKKTGKDQSSQAKNTESF